MIIDYFARLVWLICAVFALLGTLMAQNKAQGKFIDIIVIDTQRRPIPRVRLTMEGVSSVEVTNNEGKIRIQLDADTPVNKLIGIYITGAPEDLDFIDPWNRKIKVQSSVEVVLAKREYRQMLENLKVMNELLDKHKDSANSVAREQTGMISQQPQPQARNSKVINVIESDFEKEVLNEDNLVLVFVESPNGVAYSRVKLILDILADEYGSKLKIVFIDKLINKTLAQKLNAWQQPTFILYKDGKEKTRKVGSLSLKALSELIETTY